MQTNQEGGVIVYGTNFEVGRNYEIVSPLGQGAYGVVVAARVKHMNAQPEGQADGQAIDDVDGKTPSDNEPKS